MGIIKKVGGGLVVIAGAVVAAPAFAAVDLTGVSLDSTTPATLATTVLTGLGVLWGIRKLVKLINRS